MSICFQSRAYFIVTFVFRAGELIESGAELFIVSEDPTTEAITLESTDVESTQKCSTDRDPSVLVSNVIFIRQVKLSILGNSAENHKCVCTNIQCIVADVAPVSHVRCHIFDGR